MPYSQRNRPPGPRVRCSRSGATLVLLAIIVPVVFVLAAFVLELARLRYVKNQLQTAADAGSLAGASRLRSTDSGLVSTIFSLAGEGSELVRPTVINVVAANEIAHLGPSPKTHVAVQQNASNLLSGDIVVGKFSLATGFIAQTTYPNAVQTTVRFAPNHPNASLPLLFGRLLHRESAVLSATATACVERPTLLPFVVFRPQWDALMSGGGSDHYHVDPSTNTVVVGSDGNNEMTVFPNDWDGLDMPPGNFGWYDLGPGSNTSTLMRQIDQGPNESDMNYFGGDLETGDYVSGTTGLRAATETAFMGGTANDVTYEGIIGKPRIIALYDYATGSGTNAQFRIFRFVLARIVYADLSGNAGLIIQPLTAAEDPHRVRLVQ